MLDAKTIIMMQCGEFTLNSFHKKDERETMISSTSVRFGKNEIILNDGFEVIDSDGDHIYEHDATYTISREDIGRIIEVMPQEYKEDKIISEYQGANEFYTKLKTDNERILFLCILNSYKLENKFDQFFNPLKENGIEYQLSEYRY